MTDPNFFADVLDLASEVRLGVTEGRGLSPVRDTERASGGGELGGEGVVKSMTSCFETTEGDFARGVVRLTSIGVSSMTHVAISSSDSSSSRVKAGSVSVHCMTGSTIPSLLDSGGPGSDDPSGMISSSNDENSSSSSSSPPQPCARDPKMSELPSSSSSSS